MSTISGRVLVRETNAGVPDLLVVVYVADAVPDDIMAKGKPGGDAAIWKHMPGDRLGSVLTDERGHFTMEYEIDGKAPSKDRRPGLVLVLAAPEDPSTGPHPRILHVSSGGRIHPGSVESFLLKLPFGLLKEAGVDVEEPRLDPARDAAAELHARARAMAAERAETPQRPAKPFSQRYKEQLSRRGKLDARPPESVGLIVAARLANGPNLPADASITFDEQTGRFHLRPDSDAPPVPLTFAGVTYDVGRERGPVAAGISWLADPTSGELRLSLPRSATKLVATSSSALFDQYRARLRASDAVGRTADAPTTDEDEHA